jgi:hypothetical protein
MPELPLERTSARARRMPLSALCALALAGLAAPVSAQNVPPALRACAAESNSGRRLACYDREMARLTTPSRSTPPLSTPPASPAPAPRAVASTPAAPQSASRATPAHHASRLWNVFGGGSSSRVTAHVASLDRWPDAMVLHLDNGQVWQQIGRASGDLSLQVGDSVTIEKHLGSYWLSAAHVSNMQVRLKPQSLTGAGARR